MENWLWWLLAAIAIGAVGLFVVAASGGLLIAICFGLLDRSSPPNELTGLVGRCRHVCHRMLALAGKILSRIVALFIVLGLMSFSRSTEKGADRPN